MRFMLAGDPKCRLEKNGNYHTIQVKINDRNDPDLYNLIRVSYTQTRQRPHTKVGDLGTKVERERRNHDSIVLVSISFRVRLIKFNFYICRATCLSGQ